MPSPAQELPTNQPPIAEGVQHGPYKHVGEGVTALDAKEFHDYDRADDGQSAKEFHDNARTPRT